MTNAHYVTKDPYLASFVLSEGAVLADVRRLGPKIIEVRFVADRGLHELLRLYWSGGFACVVPSRLFKALRDIKSLSRARR